MVVFHQVLYWIYILYPSRIKNNSMQKPQLQAMVASQGAQVVLFFFPEWLKIRNQLK